MYIYVLIDADLEQLVSDKAVVLLSLIVKVLMSISIKGFCLHSVFLYFFNVLLLFMDLSSLK